MNCILAIDQSTSATKAVLFDDRGQVLDRATRDHRQHYPRPGWVEHDGEEIWQNCLTVMQEVVERHSEARDALAGLSLTNQRETIVVFEKGSGRPLHPVIVWQDRRGDPICRQLREAGHEDVIVRKTGLKLDTYFSGSKCKWLMDNEPDIRRKLHTGDALIGTIDAYLIYRLTRGRTFATDHTNASRTLLFDVEQRRWAPDLCALFDVPVDALPEVRESFALFGETDADGRLPNALPIRGVMGDSQASLFAQRCFHVGSGKATFGTGTSVLINVGETFKQSESGVVSALAWVREGRPTYALEGLISFSSATLAWLKDQIGLLGDTAESETLARSVEDNGGVYLIPAFAGLSAPYWQPEARAAIVGMTAHTSKAHIVRAALEAIAYQIRDVVEMIGRDAGVAPKALAADGGPTRNAFLMQLTADLTGVDLKVSDVPESSSLGAALAGMLGLGLVDSIEALASLEIPSHAFVRTMPDAEADRLYDGWKAAVRRVL